MPLAVGGPVSYTPPEGGWGWAVVVGAFISIGFSYAFPKSITVFFKEIEVIFQATSSQVSWISSIMLAVMYAAGKTIWCMKKHVKVQIFCVMYWFPVNLLRMPCTAHIPGSILIILKFPSLLFRHSRAKSHVIKQIKLKNFVN